jgi:hypothetical protein
LIKFGDCARTREQCGGIIQKTHVAAKADTLLTASDWLAFLSPSGDQAGRAVDGFKTAEDELREINESVPALSEV